MSIWLLAQEPQPALCSIATLDVLVLMHLCSLKPGNHAPGPPASPPAMLAPIVTAQVQQERAAVLAEERGNFERLLVAVSTTMNTDLPARLQEVSLDFVGSSAGGLQCRWLCWPSQGERMCTVPCWGGCT